LNLSWSNWGFGIEPLANSAARLQENEIQFIELHGNHYGPDLGYQVAETKKSSAIMASKRPAFAGCFRPITIFPATAPFNARRQWIT